MQALDMYLFGEDVTLTPLLFEGETPHALSLVGPLNSLEQLLQDDHSPLKSLWGVGAPPLSTLELGAWRALPADHPQLTLAYRAYTALNVQGAEGAEAEEDKRSRALYELLCWGSQSQLESLQSALLSASLVDELTSQDLEALRVERGAPRVGFEYTSRYTPLDIEGERLAGVSESKGCYPGQEVIERTLALGKPSRVLVRLKRDAQALNDAQEALSQRAEPLYLPLMSAEGGLEGGSKPQALGHLTSLSPAEGAPYALALLKRSALTAQRLCVSPLEESALAGLTFKLTFELVTTAEERA